MQALKNEIHALSSNLLLHNADVNMDFSDLPPLTPQEDMLQTSRVLVSPRRYARLEGNNDDPETSEAAGWASVQDYAELTHDGVLLVLCHYPFRSWNGQHRRSINLHGHSHGKLKPLPRQFDVGVDARHFRPTTLAALVGRGSVEVGPDDNLAPKNPSTPSREEAA